jgi:hypothetical protein
MVVNGWFLSLKNAFGELLICLSPAFNAAVFPAQGKTVRNDVICMRFPSSKLKFSDAAASFVYCSYRPALNIN